MSAEAAVPRPPDRCFQCLRCGEIYDEALGLPEFGIAPGTRWDDLPEAYLCIACGSLKTDFALLEA